MAALAAAAFFGGLFRSAAFFFAASAAAFFSAASAACFSASADCSTGPLGRGVAFSALSASGLSGRAWAVVWASALPRGDGEGEDGGAGGGDPAAEYLRVLAEYDCNRRSGVFWAWG